MKSALHSVHARDGLSLFCGAGVSRSAGLLDWQQLLHLMLCRYFQSLPQAKHKGRTSDYYATIYGRSFAKSSIVVARHLRRHFGLDLNDKIVSCLYCNPQTESKLIPAIARLCDPAACDRPTRSIVSFNFDDLVELELERRNVSYVVVDRAGISVNPDRVAIYHPHGFLPRQDTERPQRKVVFSEDDYHEQFGNNLGWATLSQLHLLSTTTCLLLGLSLTDPNLRRLLDASRQQELDQPSRHYVVSKRLTRDDMYRTWPGVGLSDPLIADLLTLVHMMEEEDAMSLGLNVLWVESFDEIPFLLDSIGNVPRD